MPTRLPLRVLLAVLCVAGATASFVTYRSDLRLQHAFLGFEEGADFGQTLRKLRASDSVLNPSVFRSIGIAVSLLHTGHPAAGERVMANAVRREPANVRAWTVLARIQVARGRLAAARVTYAHARRLDPGIPRALPPAI